MGNVIIIAKNTARELIRNRVLYAVLFFSIAIIVASASISHFEHATQFKLLTDISYTAITYFTMFLCLFLTMSQVSNEIDQRTIYFVLTRPVRRIQFLLGKFIGVLAILALNLVIMGITHLIALGSTDFHVIGSLVTGQLLIGCQAMILCSVVICLSTFMSSILAVVMSTFLYFFGTVASTLIHGLTSGGHHFLSTILQGMQIFLPNFNLFDLQDVVLSGDSFTVKFVSVLLLYAVLYSANFIIIANMAFNRRDL